MNELENQTVSFYKQKCYQQQILIDNFKQYDAKRKKYIEQLLNEITYLKEQRDKLMHDINFVIESIDEAKPVISNPKIKAVYFQMLEKTSNIRKELKKANHKINLLIEGGNNIDEVINDKIMELENTIKRQKEELSKLNKKIEKQK